MTHSMIRRTLKNLVQNFSEAEVKVREATSNDPWGPSSSQMADISDLTYNVVACNEIMSMLFKRLNDIGKNWRHVYKSVVLLEYLLKTGSDGVATASQENVHVVKALTEFKFIDKDGKDQGSTIRDKAKLVLALVEDPEKLKEEKEMAMKHKDKMDKATTAASEAAAEKAKPVLPPYTGLPKLDNIPSVAELMAEMAAKKEERQKIKETEEKWNAAKEGKVVVPKANDPWGAAPPEPEPPKEEEEAPAKNDPWSGESEPTPAPAKNDPWGGGSDASPTKEAPATNDPWGGGGGDGGSPKESTPASNDPWGASADGPSVEAPAANDPWGGGSDATPPKKESPPATNDPWGAGSDFAPKESPTAASNDPWGGGLDSAPKTSPPVGNDPWGTGAKSPSEDTKDPFGADADTKKSPPAASDPWGAPAPGDKMPSPDTVAPNDPWGAGPSDTTKESPPASKDPWGSSGDAGTVTSNDAPVATNDPFGGGSDDLLNDAPPPPASDDPWGAPLDAPAQSPPAKSDPWETPAAKISPDVAPAASSDLWGAATTDTAEPKPEPFDTPAVAPEPKPDPFDTPVVSEAKPDPFDTPVAQETNSDPWDAPAEAPATKSDPWDAPSDAPQTKADPWGSGGGGDAASAMSPSDPFGDSKKPDNDPWGAPATSPPAGGDPWGSSAVPTSPGGDPFGDGGSTDAWGTPTKSATNGDLTDGAKSKASAQSGLSAWLDGLSLDLTMPTTTTQGAEVKQHTTTTIPVSSSSLYALVPPTPSSLIHPFPAPMRPHGPMGTPSSYTPPTRLPQGAPPQHHHHYRHLNPMGGFHPTAAPLWGAAMGPPIHQGAPYGGSLGGVPGAPMAAGIGVPLQPLQPSHLQQKLLGGGGGGGGGMGGVPKATVANNNPFLL